MNILIVGGGGREHALAWKAAQSPLVNQVWVAPGNAGTNQEKKVSNIEIPPTDIEHLIDFAKQKSISLTIVGPEIPLALGIVDQFQEKGLRCFGPTKAAAQLESSKNFSKKFMQRANIPTAKYASFTEIKPALEYCRQNTFPIVIKADGLAAGKGVVIAETFSDAEKAIKDMLGEEVYGNAGKSLLIEEFLQGEEISFIVMSDGKSILPLASSQDHKRRDEGDLGPNTGGMGAYSPAPQLTKYLHDKIMKTIIEPAVTTMANHGTPYVGFLYAGLMITQQQEPYVLEFNCRLGDPETQPILMRLKSDLISLCNATLDGKLNTKTVEWDPRFALSVVMTAGGYPGNYRKGDVIQGLDFSSENDVKIFHAGTTLKNHDIVTNGGRVLSVTALGDDLKDAQALAYKIVSQIHWPNCFFRKDIGYRAIKL